MEENKISFVCIKFKSFLTPANCTAPKSHEIAPDRAQTERKQFCEVAKFTIRTSTLELL